ESAAQDVDFRASLFSTRTRRETANHVGAARVGLEQETCCRSIVRAQQRCRCNRDEQRPAVRRLGAAEIARRDADHREWHIVQPNLPPDDAGVAAETAVPEVESENGDCLRRAKMILV